MQQAKKFLVILELNNVLFYLNNPRKTSIDFSTNHVPVKYQQTYKGLNMSLRSGRMQFLNHLFMNLRSEVDIAVWSNLNNEFTKDLCHKYFTRYFRDLLFILATNRALYGQQEEHEPIKVRKDLGGVFNRFPMYNQGNTIVVTALPNLVETHLRNDLIVPEYSPSHPDFKSDPGLAPLVKYLQGLVLIKEQSQIGDIRRIIQSKQAKNIFKRVAHNMQTQRIYI